MPVIFQPVRTWRFAAQLLPNALASAALTLGILAVAVSVWIVVHTYSPVLFWDQWEIVRTLMKSHGHFTLRDLWAQHNEHRIVTGRLFGFADLYWFGGRNVSLYVEIIGLQLCHLLLLIYLVRRFGRLPAAVYATVVGFLAYCLFSPIQMENFIWAFQTVFILTSLAATACCAAALIHADRGAGGEGKRKPIWLFIAILCAFTAEVTEAHGLVTWPVLLFLAFALRFSPRDRIIVFVAAGVAITAYMIGYHSPDSPQALTKALRQPGKILHFVLTYLGRSWDPHLPNPSVWPSVSESVTAVAIALTLAAAVRCLRRPLAFSPLQIALLGNLMFVLGTAAMTAVGRLQYGGLGGATAIRYQTPALIFWGSLTVLLAVSVDWTTARRRLPVAQAPLLILMIAGGGRWYEMGHFAEGRQYGQETAWNAIARGRFSDPDAAHIFFEPKMLETFAAYMREHHWGPPGPITYFARLQATSRTPRIQGYQLRTNCVGQWEEARRLGFIGVAVAGWGLSESAGEAPRRVAFASSAGKIIGYAELKAVRQDVASQHSTAQGVRTGWEAANVDVPREDVYHAFLISEKAGAACPLSGELQIRHYPVF